MRYKTNESQRGQADTAMFRLAQFLGIFSLLLGTIELIWGGPIARALGLEGQEWIVRVYGAREFINGVLIFLSKNDPTPWIWLRVAGDALDAQLIDQHLRRAPQGRRSGAIGDGAVKGHSNRTFSV